MSIPFYPLFTQKSPFLWRYAKRVVIIHTLPLFELKLPLFELKLPLFDVEILFSKVYTYYNISRYIKDRFSIYLSRGMAV